MKSRIDRHLILAAIMYFLCFEIVLGQESVFTGLRSDLRRADEYFLNESFNQALELYLMVQKTKKAPGDIALKIARTYYGLRDNQSCAIWYGKYVDFHGSLPAGDELTYAECLSSVGSYKDAIIWFEKHHARNPDDQTVQPKIWRLKNIEYLYEDSTYYSVKPVAFNSLFSEFGPTYYQGGLVFVSNQRGAGRIQKIDGMTNTPFYTLFFTKQTTDTLNKSTTFSKPVKFGIGLDSKFHKGSVAFLPGEEKMIYTKSVVGIGNLASTLQLFLAQNVNGIWVEIEPFPYNSANYSVSHPSLSSDGSTLYFVSDMPGGFGGKDIYKSLLRNNTWTKPENLGVSINSANDETYPFCHHDATLYFASNGHGGFGGLDIFNVSLDREQKTVQNIGYPVNTGFDDFGLVLNGDGTRGFFSSNRNRGKLDDDIFEIEVDLQTYPLIISGVINYRTSDMQDSSELKLLTNATLLLIDDNTNLEVGKTFSDSLGRFTLEIPYSSQYRLLVIEKSIGQNFVSLEIPKNKKLHTNYQLVVVKDRFRRPDSEPHNKEQ